MLPPLTSKATIEKTVREEWGRILASLVSNLNDFQLAEDCLQDAIVSAFDHWEKNGLPHSPAAWLITVARRKAIDRLRRTKTAAEKQNEVSYLIELEHQDKELDEVDIIPDKRLEMIFTCCHPALGEKTSVALTLRTLGGLSTEEIASAFLDKPDAMQQRLTRAKKKIALAGIPYKIPEKEDLEDRISGVLRTIYLVFNEGYSASSGDNLTRTDLSEEAIRLARIVHQLLPQQTEAVGLLALMLLHDSRRLARTGPDGEMIALSDQNRSRWNRAKINEGVSILKGALVKKRIGSYQLQAAISAVHAQSMSWAETDWVEISALYELLYDLEPTPIIRINQAVAISFSRSLERALEILDEAAADGELDNYQPYFAAKADLLFRAGRKAQALDNMKRAIALSDNHRERAFLEQKSIDMQ